MCIHDNEEICIPGIRLEIFTAMIQVMVFWVMTVCSDVTGYQCFGGPCYFHHQGEVNDTKKGDTEG